MNQGDKLKAIAKAKGYSAKSLSDRLGVTPLTVENDFKAEVLTRRVISKYLPVLGIDADSFFDGEVVDYPMGQEGLLAELKHKSELLQAKEETIADLRKTVDTLSSMLRFFPNAAVPAIQAIA